MAQSRSGKKRTSGSTRSSASRSASRGSRNTYAKNSRRARRREERLNVMWSIPLAGIGLLFIVMVLVSGKSFWHDMRAAIFGVFGIVTYFIGPLLLYLAYLVASRYQVGKFTAKTLLMALMVASVPVVFSGFSISDGDTPLRIIRDLFNWSYDIRHFWSGGVFGGVIGGTLLALCGRPVANLLMILLFVVGLMVFFAVTPLDIVQFCAYQAQRFRDARAASAAEENAYDTPLFRQEAEEEPIENLTETLPQQRTRSAAHHRPFDVMPYLEEESARPGQQPAATPVRQSPAASVSNAMPQPVRSEFDVDLGPNSAQRSAEEALQHDPLEPVVIGPGGTFGMDPLEVGRPPVAPKAVEMPKPAMTQEEFELHLDSEPEPPMEENEDGLDELIRKAVGVPGQEDVSSEVRLDVAAQPAHTRLGGTYRPLGGGTDGDTVVLDGPISPDMLTRDANGIPVLNGSFAVAKEAWKEGIPMTDVLSGRGIPTPPTPEIPPQMPPDAGVVTQGGTEEAGNSLIQPTHTPPRAGAVSAGTAASASALRTAPEPPEPYAYPSLNLFRPQKASDNAGAAQEMKKNADTLVNTLESFGVKTKIMDICRGPSVTRYELQPQAGVKISRITNLADDIALNLATAGVRIEAPIPGKPAVGIEVPNRIRSAVNIRGVFESQNYINMRSPLTMALGQDIAGVAQVADLCKMPHLLIAGSTGSGKSVCVNSIIISFLFRSSPDDCKLILIDPKVVELAEYNGIPHLLMPVVTEPRKAAGALGASVAEMERRYKLFAENNVRDIKTYNKFAALHPELEHLPYIAIVIDELADLMMVAGKEVEDYICRIAQKARAAGIHLIIATQRPSVDVITGLIKANIPSRIAFAVSSQIDSRTILDGGGAEKLLGNGDMLFLPVGAPKPTRIQGTFVTDEEISAVLNFIKTTSTTQYDEEMIAEMERRAVAEGKNSSGGEDDGDASSSLDPMFEAAVECVIDAGQASTSLLQRRCKLGYARAARIVDQMEQEKIVGPYEGSKPRAVLITRSQWQERKLSAQDSNA